ncbi:MAG TPA: protein translocase subunit SecF [Candidatus Limnocylindrales bacterium]|nr:protein translocase subunit SecF [Candidatus Limnocylindrales bacterium]
MFDVIGKRRWFYAFSTLITIPGLIFILLTPLSGGKTGLQFSIDYTGGTVWQLHFANGNPAPADVVPLLEEAGLTGSTVATVTRGTERQYLLIRTEEAGLRPPEPTPTPTPSGSPGASPGQSASPGASAGPTGSASSGASPSPTAAPSASPSPSPSPSASPSPSPAPGGGVVGTCQLPTEGKLGAAATALVARFGPIDDCPLSAVGPVISQELTQQAFLLIAFGSIGILLWITFRFGDFRMGVAAIVALVHDVIVVVGTFAILGALLGVQIDALFVTAMLTVIGFSVHDTIVVFDRIRENRVRHAGEPFAAIVNHSVLQTFGRSINTSLTVVLTLSALLLFGGDAIRVFVLALLLGIVSGTYSSIFNASPLLVSWHEWDERKRQRELTLARSAR